MKSALASGGADTCSRYAFSVRAACIVGEDCSIQRLYTRTPKQRRASDEWHTGARQRQLKTQTCFGLALTACEVNKRDAGHLLPRVLGCLVVPSLRDEQGKHRMGTAACVIHRRCRLCARVRVRAGENWFKCTSVCVWFGGCGC